jgi:hypothetical protein
MILAHLIRGEIDQLEYIVYELDRGPCTEQLAEKLNDIGSKLCNLSDEFYAATLAIPDGGHTSASHGAEDGPLRNPQNPGKTPKNV